MTDRRGLRIVSDSQMLPREGRGGGWLKGTGQSMNDVTSQFDGDANQRGAARDVTLTRLLDGRASSAQWRELRAWTEKDAAGREDVWDDLIAQSEQNDALVKMVGVAAARAERVEAEPRGIAGVIGTAVDADEREQRGDERAGGRGGADRLGWLVAAVLAVGFVTFAIRSGPIDRAGTPGGLMNEQLAGSGRVTGGTAQAGLGSGLTAGLGGALSTPDEALGEYLRLGQMKGQVLGELPQRVMLQSRELGEGKGREVLYLRQIVERAVVKDVYKLGTNDVGEAVMVPAPDWSNPGDVDRDDQHAY